MKDIGDVVINLYQMFSVPCIVIECSNWGKQKKQLNNLYKSTQFHSKDGLSTDYFAQKTFNKFSYLKDVEEIFSDELKEFKESVVSPTSSFDMKVIAAWFEAAKFGSYHTHHTHGAMGYSAVCYIDYDKNEHDATHFIAPFFNFLTGDDIHFSVPHTKEGMIVFFPSCVAHYTEPNFSKKVRRVLSFNLRFFDC